MTDRQALTLQRIVSRVLFRAPPNTSRLRLQTWVTEAARLSDAPAFKVLDAGSGIAPYRNLFDKVTYHTADFAQVDKTYGQIDFVCDLAEIPVEDCSYDLVLATQVLEHISDPISVLTEFHRILKPGGQAWMSAPLFYHEHEQPFDFYRYTQFAWRHMADRAGFQSVDVEWLEGYCGTLSYQCSMAARLLPTRWLLWRLFLASFARRMAKAEMRDKITSVGMPKNYRCVLRKSADAIAT